MGEASAPPSSSLVALVSFSPLLSPVDFSLGIDVDGSALFGVGAPSSSTLSSLAQLFNAATEFFSSPTESLVEMSAVEVDGTTSSSVLSSGAPLTSVFLPDLDSVFFSLAAAANAVSTSISSSPPF